MPVWTLVLAVLAGLVIMLVTMAVNGFALGFILRWFRPVCGRKWINEFFMVVCVVVSVCWNSALWLGVPVFGVSLKPLLRVFYG